MANKRIIVAGDVKGKFSTFFKRLKNVNDKAGPFDFVLCAGSFFSFNDEDSEDHNLVYIAKEFDLKLPIYVLGPVIETQKRFYKPLFEQNLRGVPSFEEGYDIAVNVTYLGKQGVLTTVDDVKIAYLSGIQSEVHSDYAFDLNDIDDLINTCSSAGRIDILLATSFPFRVNEFSLCCKSKYLTNLNETGAISISKLARFILPRYHFAASEDEFYEREPYRNHIVMQEQPKLVTRFVSVARVREESKPKWLYAFELKPAKGMSKDEINKQPDDTSENPYINIDFEDLKLIKKEKDPDAFNNGSFFFDQSTNHMNNNRNNNRQDRSNRSNDRFDNRNHDRMNNNARNRNQNRYDSDNQSSSKRLAAESGQMSDECGEKRIKSSENTCWFCLSSSQVEKHLIISIGEHSYLALAKGGMVDYHLLILPIGHYRSIAEIESNQDLSEVMDEIGKFKNAIIDFFISKDQIAVFFERNFKSGHLQLQAIAVPREKSSQIKKVLYAESDSHKFKVNEMQRGSTISDSLESDKVPYFYIEFQGKRFFIGIKASRGFPMQFGRSLLSHEEILNCSGKIDWRESELSADEAKQLVIDIRKEFKRFDFTL